MLELLIALAAFLAAIITIEVIWGAINARR
jgi:hypothetical protein